MSTAPLCCQWIESGRSLDVLISSPASPAALAAASVRWISGRSPSEKKRQRRHRIEDDIAGERPCEEKREERDCQLSAMRRLHVLVSLPKQVWPGTETSASSTGLSNVRNGSKADIPSFADTVLSANAARPIAVSPILES